MSAVVDEALVERLARVLVTIGYPLSTNEIREEIFQENHEDYMEESKAILAQLRKEYAIVPLTDYQGLKCVLEAASRYGEQEGGCPPDLCQFEKCPDDHADCWRLYFIAKAKEACPDV